MTRIRVLNLYAGLGGNVALLDRSKYCITAVELNENIAGVYKRRFPSDQVIVADAHQYLLEHFSEFDFIWSSPPCQTHNRSRFSTTKNVKPYYADMRLYQEIVFLRKFCTDQKWVVENVIPYYQPFIPPTNILERHFLWSNFIINVRNRPGDCNIEGSNVGQLLDYHKLSADLFDGFNFTYYEKRQSLRNCCSLWFSEIIDNCYNLDKNEKYFQLSLDLNI